MRDRDEADRLKRKLDEQMKKRIQLMLHTPNARLSSLEALRILDGFNIVDEVTMLDTLKMRHTVSYEIEQLEQMEFESNEKKESREELKNDIIIKVVATDPLATADFEHYCKQSGYEFLESYNENEKLIIRYKFKN